jgi:DNA-binding NarL/FixJ family response regulator
MSDIRIVLIEDNDVVRYSMRTILQSRSGIVVVGEAATGQEGLALLKTAKADVALLDISLSGIDGIELTQQFRQFQQHHPSINTKILILTMLGSEDAVLASFAAGADSYCMKNIETNLLIEAIQMTNSGNPWIDPPIASIVLRQMRQCMTHLPTMSRTVEIRSVDQRYEQTIADYPLTSREHEVLELLVEGHTNMVIADKLFITLGTVKTHVRNILVKLCAHDRTEAAVRALRSGIIS